MATLTIRIDLDNDAFQPEPGPEVARILHDLAGPLECLVLAPRDSDDPLILRDYFGNACGQVTVTA